MDPPKRARLTLLDLLRILASIAVVRNHTRGATLFGVGFGLILFLVIMFALASYNGGQTRIRRLRRETEEQGLDPNVWFHNVELAVARVIGRETLQFVRNIYRYYLVLRIVEEKRARRKDRAAD